MMGRAFAPCELGAEVGKEVGSLLGEKELKLAKRKTKVCFRPSGLFIVVFPSSFLILFLLLFALFIFNRPEATQEGSSLGHFLFSNRRMKEMHKQGSCFSSYIVLVFLSASLDQSLERFSDAGRQRL